MGDVDHRRHLFHLSSCYSARLRSGPARNLQPRPPPHDGQAQRGRPQPLKPVTHRPPSDIRSRRAGPPPDPRSAPLWPLFPHLDTEEVASPSSAPPGGWASAEAQILSQEVQDGKMRCGMTLALTSRPKGYFLRMRQITNEVIYFERLGELQRRD